MPGKRINLLSQQIVSPRVHSALFFLRLATFVSGAITIIVLTGLFFVKSRAETNYAQLLTQKESLINEFSARRETVQKVQLVALKSNALSGLLEKDPHFKTYFTLLNSILPVSTGSATINTFTVDKSKLFKTTVVFGSQAEAYEFMNNVESNTFKNVFATLIVDSLSIGQTVENGPTVSVNLSGTFK